MSAIPSVTHTVFSQKRVVPEVTIPGNPPSQSAFMLGAITHWGGKNYDCTQPGLYVFFDPAGGRTQRKIAFDSYPPQDVLALLSGICHNHVHGTYDEAGQNWQTSSNRGAFGRWRLRCGSIVGLTAWLMPQVGLTARAMSVVTNEPLNAWDDNGHVVLEVHLEGKWRMFDLTLHRYYQSDPAAGISSILSTSEFISQIANGGEMPSVVQLDGGLVPIFAGEDRDLSESRSIGELTRLCTVDTEAWVRRIFQRIY